MMSAPYPRTFALGFLLAANLLSKCSAFAQGVATIVQTVTPAQPGLTWQAPAAIPFGTAVSSVQLDAKAATPGTFTYIPAAGTILPPGQSTLSVSFKPDDPNFLAGTLTVPVTILPSAARSFSFALTVASAAQGPFLLRAGKTDAIHFSLAKLLNLDQVVTLACSDPLGETECSFTPSTVPLGNQPYDVSLVVRRASGKAQQGSGKTSRESGTGTPVNDAPGGGKVVTAGFLLAIALGSGARRVRARWAGPWWHALIALPVACLLLGCGSGKPYHTSRQIVITASSPYESHSVEITVVLEDGGHGDREPIRRLPIPR